MSNTTEDRLRKLKLSEDEYIAVLEMVSSEGFNVWRKKIMRVRENEIRSAAINSADMQQLYYFKGMSYENGNQLKDLAKIAKKAEKLTGAEDDDDDGVTDDQV